MITQLELTYGDRWRDRQISESCRCELRAVVEEVGIKKVASELDRGHSELRRALAEEERHYLRLDEIVSIMRRDSTGRALQALANALGYDISKRRELDAAEKLQRLTGELEKSPLIARAIYEAAFGPGGRP